MIPCHLRLVYSALDTSMLATVRNGFRRKNNSILPLVMYYKTKQHTLNFGPAQETEPPWHKPMVVNGTVVGPFVEEEEGTGIASDVVKVEGEDPATPGLLP